MAQTNPSLSATRMPRAFTAMRHRNFQLYFIGQLISNAGTWMQIIAQGWLVYQLTHSEFALGVVSFASAIPVLFVTPFGGVVVDRVPKRTLLVITQSATMLLAFALAALAFTNVVREWHIFVLAALIGVVNAFDAPARQAFVVEMVGKEDMPNAIALNSMMFNSARVIGPGIGGLLLAAFGPAWCFTINGLSFLAVIAGLLLMKLPPHPVQPARSAAIPQLVEGVRYVSRHADMWGLLVLAIIFSMFGLSYSTLLPAFADTVLHGGPEVYGWLNAATGVGAVISALLIAQFGDRGKRGVWLNAANFTFPIVLALFALTPLLAPSLLLACLLGMGFMTHMTMSNTLLQTRVEDQFRGRVMSLFTLTFFGLSPFGNLLIGALGQQFGLMPAMLFSAALTWLLSRLIFRLARNIRALP
jgi:MFS family permease